MTGKLIVICAPSGTGKSTLIQRLCEDMPELKWSVSSTTRPKREGEVHGREYYFVTIQEFERDIAAKNFIEWFKVHNDYKGTSKRFVDEGLAKGWNMLFDLDVQGADAIKKIYGDRSQVIFIEPPSMEELEKRLRERKSDTEEQIRIRVENARKELARKNDYDYLIMNDNVDRAYQKLKATVEKILA